MKKIKLLDSSKTSWRPKGFPQPRISICRTTRSCVSTTTPTKLYSMFILQNKLRKSLISKVKCSPKRLLLPRRRTSKGSFLLRIIILTNLLDKKITYKKSWIMLLIIFSSLKKKFTRPIRRLWSF